MKMKTLLVCIAMPVLLATAYEAKRVEYAGHRVQQRIASHFEGKKVLFPGYHNVEALAPGSAPSGPHVGNCAVFPKDNIWNTPIDTLPKHPKSDTYIRSIGFGSRLHPDFSSGQYGIPFTEIPAGTKPVKISFQYGGESDNIPYLIPPDAPIEGGPNSPGDKHVIAIDPRTCMLYEIWEAKQVSPGVWKGGSGAIFDMKTNALRKSGVTSADAAGLPIFPGLVRYDEIEAGEIAHALRFTIPNTQSNFIWPARHLASTNPGTNLAPLGARFRLKADFDISNYSKTNRIILKALKRYGMFLADNGSGLFISGVPDKRWDDDDLHKLTQITTAAFEVVDEADLQKSDNSGAVVPSAVKQ